MPLQVMLLGGFEIRLDTAEPIALDQPRLQLLAGYLLLHANVPQLRSHLAFHFWPDSTERQARTNLRKLLHTLRNTHPALDGALVLTSETVCWRVHPDDRVDVVQFCAALEKTPVTLDLLMAAVEHYRGELLPGHYENWVLAAREELHLRYLNALSDLVGHHMDAGEPRRALPVAQRLVQGDDLQEASYRSLIQVHLELGDTAAALRVYHSCARRLRDELGVDPSPETESLHARILRAGEAGIGEPADAREVFGARRESAGDLHAPFGGELVGRRLEWHRLRHLWLAAQRGRPQLVVIRGEPGIGKTRLAQELVETARRQGCATLSARAYAAEGRTAYGPVADLLRTETVLSALGTLDATWRLELGRILPELTPHDREPLEPLRESWQQRRFHAALVRGCLAVGSPLLIHLDDLQWCDPETLQWIHFLLREAHNAPLLVVGTLRGEEVDGEHPWHALRHALLQRGMLEEIDLPALSQEAVGELVTHALEDTLPAPAIATLYATTGGNPFFVLESLHALNAGLGAGVQPTSDQATGSAPLAQEIGKLLSRADLPMPTTPRVQALVQARLNLLSRTTRQVLQAATVIGRSFTFDLLQAVVQFGTEQADGDLMLVSALDELWQRRIIRDHGADGYDFGHDHIRDAAYTQLSPMMRGHLHGRVARALETRHAEDVGAVSAQLAAHWEAAGQPATAIDYYRQAATYALDRFALHEGKRYLQRAIGLAPADQLELRYELHLQLDSIYYYSGRSAAARVENLKTLESLADTLYARAVSDYPSDYPEQAATSQVNRAGSGAYLPQPTQANTCRASQSEWQRACARRATVLTRKAEVVSNLGDSNQAIALSKEAIALAQSADALPEQAHAHCVLGWSGYWYVGDMVAAERELQHAATLAAQLGMEELEAVCLDQLAATGMFSGMPAQDMLGYLQRANGIYRQQGNIYHQAGVLNKFSYIVLAQGEGDYAKGLEGYHQALALIQGVRIDSSEGASVDNLEVNIMNNLCMMYLAHGDYAQAEKWIGKAYAGIGWLNVPFSKGILLSYLAALRSNQGRLDEAVALCEQSLAELGGPGIEHRVTETLLIAGLAHLLREDTDAARHHLQKALMLANSRGDQRFQATANSRLGHLYLMQGADTAAQPAFARAYELRLTLQQYRRSLEPLSGLAQLAWQRVDHDALQPMLDTLTTQLLAVGQDYTVDGFFALARCCELLEKLHDPRAPQVRAAACEHLNVRSRFITDAAAHADFWGLPPHRAFRP